MTTHSHLSGYASRLSVAFLFLISLTACTRDETPVTPTDPTRIVASTPQELRKGLDNFLSTLSQNPSLPSKTAQSHQKYGNRLAQNLSVGLVLFGTDKSKLVKGFDVQTQTVGDVFEMFHVGGLTWNADDILPESEVLGMTQSNKMIRTNGAATPYEIRDRLADMDYNLTLRP